MARKSQPTRADRNIAWIEEFCLVPEGKLVGQRVRLREWQRDALRAIYDNPAGTRRAILSFGRKNGKTALSACILLLHLCGPEARPNSQLFSAAQSRDQAAILFALAAKMVRMLPDLNDNVTVRDTAKQLFCPELGTLYRALSAEASTAYGLSPVLIIHDELGQVKGPRSELYEALETATGAQEHPLSIIISTQAPTDADLLSVLIEDAQAGHDPRVVLALHTAPTDLDPFSEEAIRAANPAFGDFQNAAETLAMAEDARRMPSREPEYRNLILNQRVDMNAPFVAQSVWKACGGPVVDDWSGRVVFAGLDLAKAAEDMTALVLVTPVEGKWHAKPYYWLPVKGLVEKSRADRVPYDLWHRDGWLEVTPGAAVDYDHVARRIEDILSDLDVRAVAFDPYNWSHMRPALMRAGFTSEELPEPREPPGDKLFRPMRQGWVTMSPALTNLESAILDGLLVHGSHPILDANARNATVEGDKVGNRMLSKIKSHGRIDGMVALAMAMSVAGTWEGGSGPSVYEDRGLLVI